MFINLRMNDDEEENTKAKKASRKRPDRKEKLAQRKEQNETVVKCCLEGKLNQRDPETLTKIKNEIEKRVLACSRRTVRASISLNYMIKEAFDGKTNVQEASVPEFWDQTFIRQLMVGVERANDVKPDIKAFFERHPNMVGKEKRSTSDKNIYTAAAIKYLTNVKNHLVLNFMNVLKKYLYNLSGLNKDEAILALFRINGWEEAKIKPKPKPKKKTKKKDDLKEQPPIVINEHKVSAIVKLIRNILGMEEKDKLHKLWFKKEENIPYMVKLFMFVARELEVQKPEKVKSFDIVPICKIKTHFITLDTVGLYGIMRDINYVNEKCREENFRTLKKEHWETFLNFGRVQGRNKTFTGTIDTDGISVCIHFTRPKNQIEIENEDYSLEGKRVLGCDPGRTVILQMVEELPDGTFKSYRLTRSQYYQESGIFQARKRTENWTKTILQDLEALSKASSKGASLQAFQTYLEAIEKHQEALWTEYTKQKWRHQRMRLYGGKKRAFAKFLNKLESPDKNVETIIAFGSAKFAPGGKGELSVPTSRAFKECSYRFRIRLTCEFRSTRVYYKDHSLLEKVGKYDKDKKLVAVRGLLWSSSSNVNKFVNRDLNASINILKCAILPERPTIFKRGKSIQKLPEQRIAKIIKE